MKNKQYINSPFYTLGIAVFVSILLSASLIQGQDYSKVIEVVQKMESNLKAQIASEQKSRKAEFAILKEQIEILQKNATSATSEKHGAVNQVSATNALTMLKKGNERYTSGTFSKKDYVQERKATANSQHPYAIVLTCADSRVAPELLFDESIGKLFVIRDAGNVVDSVILGTIEYAADHLNVKLILILGHESCGAVTATVAGGDVSPNISSLVNRMKPPVDKVKQTYENDDNLVSKCVEENVKYQIEQTTLQSGLLSELAEKSNLKLVGGVYDISSGKVRFLNTLEQDSQIENEETSHVH